MNPIDIWLNSPSYSALTPGAGDFDLRVVRSKNEWDSVVPVLRPYDQTLHTHVNSLLQNTTLSTAWGGHFIPEVSCDYIEGKFSSLSIKSAGMDAGDRAALEVLSLYAQGRNPRELRILVAEPFSSLSLAIRGRFPRCLATGYLPDEPNSLFPVQHVDLLSTGFDDQSFDVLVSIEVLEHLPDYQKSLEEAARIIRDNRVYIFTCPFYWFKEEAEVKAIIEDGELKYLSEPEYHGDPLRPENGILVFQIPAWDLIDHIKSAGFSDAAAVYISSVKSGIIGKHIRGCFVFVCQK